MMPQIHGNIEGLRQSFLSELETLYDWEVSRTDFAPTDLVEFLAERSRKINREIAIYVTRDGEVVDVIVGSVDNVPLSDFRLRRNEKRLSMVRCIHTHPGGSGNLSDVDESALRTMRFDAMAAIGIPSTGSLEVGVGFLGAPENGEPVLRIFPPVPYRKLPQKAWMEEIQHSDEMLQSGQENKPENGPERVILVGTESDTSLDELERLAQTAGAVIVGRALQKRGKPDGATFIGRGKAETLSLDCQALYADAAIFDEELTGIQMRNLEDILRVKVIDRTTLILDIFAQRATTREGKLQVELAQLSYRSTRLIGQGLILSRLAGGIGTRGPGESKLEMTRRRIRERVTQVRQELEQMEKQRDLRRKSREKNQIPVVALVGYTNAGKSTLLNRLSGADVYVKDQLFATLDAVSRKVTLPMGGEFLLVDTVGFIRKLPHTLVEAFHSTLEEAALADVLVIVSDASSPEVMQQHQVVLEVLDSLDASHQPRIEVLNKSDVAQGAPFLPGAIQVSALTGDGLPELLSQISQNLNQRQEQVTLMIPFSQYALINEVRAMGRIINEEHMDEGTKVTALIAPSDKNRLISKYGSGIFLTNA